MDNVITIQLNESVQQNVKKLITLNRDFENLVHSYTNRLKSITKDNNRKAYLFISVVDKKNKSLNNFKYDFVNDVLSKRNLNNKEYKILSKSSEIQRKKLKILLDRINDLRSNNDFMQSIELLNVTYDRYVERFKKIDLNIIDEGIINKSYQQEQKMETNINFYKEKNYNLRTQKLTLPTNKGI